MTEHFETYYVKDWGTDRAAHKARDARRQSLIKGRNGAFGIVKGKVHHPHFGIGYDLWYVGPGDGSVDTRIAPPTETEPFVKVYPQTPPSHVLTQEKWEASPTW